MIPYNRNLKDRARELRNHMTEAEKTLWTNLRHRQIMNYVFYRQKPVGNFIVDFYCPKARLVIEVDGGLHLSREAKAIDKDRDIYTHSLGLTTLRFTNEDVLDDTPNVLARITHYIRSHELVKKSHLIPLYESGKHKKESRNEYAH